MPGQNHFFAENRKMPCKSLMTLAGELIIIVSFFFKRPVAT